MKRVLILNVLLLAIVAGLVVQIAALWWRTEAEVDQVAPRETKPQRPEVPNVVRRPAPADLATSIANKDLFDQSRAPAAAPGPASILPTPVQPLTLVLLGVIGAGEEREALVKDQAQPKPIWLRQGEEIGGYKLGRINTNSIVMVAPAGDQVTLMINVEKGKPQAVPVGPAGIQPTPAPGAVATRNRPGPIATPVMAQSPGSDIREKIERLRQEARRRRGQGHGE